MKALVTCSLLAALATVPAGAQLPPVRPLGRSVVVSRVPFLLPTEIRALSNGRILVHDRSRRTVLSLDSALADPIVVIDSVPGKDNSYGARQGALLPYRGDSSVFVDAAATSMLILDPAGRIGRQVSPPPASVSYLTVPTQYGYPGLDGRGRLVFRMPAPRAPLPPPIPGEPRPTVTPVDSAILVAFDFATRAVDTLKIGVKLMPSLLGSGLGRGANAPAPSSSLPMLIPTVDDWAVTSTGAVAVVRGLDYHVDWIDRDGSRRASPKITYEWRRLSDDDKARMADSATRFRDSTVLEMLARTPPTSNMIYDVFGGIAGFSVPARGGGEPAPPPRGAAAAAAMAPKSPPIPVTAIPDYIPPFSRGAVRADADGNLWVLTTPPRPVSGGPVYDVIDGRGVLIDRVQIPQGKFIVGFAPGSVFLLSRDAGVGQLERARIR